jgi:hypothetical protein
LAPVGLFSLISAIDKDLDSNLYCAPSKQTRL